MINAPCKDCPDRYPACSGRCERYKEYRAELDAQKAYTDRMTRNRKVYHAGYRDKERDLKRPRCLFGQK